MKYFKVAMVAVLLVAVLAGLSISTPGVSISPSGKLAIESNVALAVNTGGDFAPSGQYSPGQEIISERGRAHRVYYVDEDTCEAVFVGSPEFTNSGGQWVDYVFTDMGTYYQVQHPWSSAKFYDYYTEVWNEEFTQVKIYDDRWTIEYLNKQSQWIEADLYSVNRSYEVVSDGIKVKRTGNTDIGQRQEIYFYHNASPCKIEIRQTCTEAQAIRFVWKTSGIVAASETEMKDDQDRTAGLNYYDSSGNFVQTIRWYDELDICDFITPVVETHAQGRKATVTFSQFDVAAGSTAILDPDIFYPDAHEETSSVDGCVDDDSNNIIWANLIIEPGSHFDDSSTGYYAIAMAATATSNQWRWLARSIFLFDTSGLPDGAVISAAVLTLYGQTKDDGLSITPDINIYSSNPASNIALEAGDFNSLGATAFCDTPITYAGFNTGDPGDPNDFSLNASGIAAISKTSVSKFGARNANYDVAESAPDWTADWNSYLYAYMAEKGTGYKPKLVVTYTLEPSISNTPSSKAFGVVSNNTSYWSNGSAPNFPLDDSECYFTVTNNGDTSSITIKATNFTGGVGWTLGTPAENVARLKAGKSGDASEAAMVTLTTSEQAFISGLPGSSSKKWEIKLEAPTSFTDGVQKTSTITLTATLD